MWIEKRFFSGRLKEYVWEENGNVVAMLSFGNTADHDKAGALKYGEFILHQIFKGKELYTT